MKELQIRPYALQDDKTRLYSLGTYVSVLASSQQTGGAFNLFDVVCPSSFETPLHIHYAEDVAIYILGGGLEIFWGDEKKRAEVGSFFFQPRGIPHGFRVTGLTDAHILYITFPAGFDKFVIGRSKPIGVSEMRISEAHFKIEVMGLLPE
jgi:quercetin dioxygenase-like cupin family protein